MRPSCTTVLLDDAARRRLRVAAAIAGVTQAEIIRQGLSDRLAAIEADHPEVQRILAAA